jgi:HSP20 family molecular chaperone IbpA
MPLFTRFVVNPYAPFLEDFASFANSRSSGFSKAVRSFQPRFDVSETKEAYTLTGEFPGIKQEEISIEFTDANTLSIKGRTERHREEGTRPEAQVEAPVEQPEVEAAEPETSSYHKASVEDESEPTMSGGNPDATPAETPAETPATSVAEAETQEVAQPSKPKSKYWVSERSVGEFARTFTFPARSVDQENVRASLKDGILSVLVPKVPLPENRRINIE